MSDRKKQLGLFPELGEPEPQTGPKSGGRGQARKAPVTPEPASPAHRAWAQALPKLVRLGTSSWSFPGWEGILWRGKVSASQLAKEGLAAYGQHPLLRTVGVDRTFYAPVGPDVLAAYAAQVPEDFRFLVKAHEGCTFERYPSHARYGARSGERNPLYLDAAYATDAVVRPFVEGLGPKGGPLLFQFPPRPKVTAESARAFAEDLGRFLGELPRGPLYAVELRNPELLTADYVQALRAGGAVHVLNVWGDMPPLEEQWARAGLEHAEATVVRWMLPRGVRYEEALERFAPFHTLAEPDESARAGILEALARSVGRGRAAYVIVNNKAEGSSPLSVFELAARLVALLDTKLPPRP